MLLSAVVERSIETLHTDHGARFVALGGPDVLPFWRAWNTCRRPGLATVLNHVETYGADKIGILPWSIRTTAFDVDEGVRLVADILPEARAILPTRRGEHW